METGKHYRLCLCYCGDGTIIFLDNIFVQLIETPTLMHKYIKGMNDREK
jgi:hypothetical protein